MNQPPDPDSMLVFSYLELRRAIGVLGIALPFVVALGGSIVFGSGIQDSISGYYYTGMRNVLVGTLCSIGVFLLSYKGYERVDAIAGTCACVFAVGVALFPTVPVVDPTSRQEVIGHVHLAFASLFFATLAFFSLSLFTRTDPEKPPTGRKLQRNRVYRTCGFVMVACLIAIIIVHVILSMNPHDALGAWNPVFWLESVAIVAFGVSWITKGEALLKDDVR